MRLVVAGTDAGTSEADAAAPGKALPPWLLRQGITSTSTASAGQPRHPLTQNGAGSSIGAGAADETTQSAEEDQKKIEVGS